MNAISGRSSAVKGSATLVMDPVAAFRPAVSSGFKFTSVMLTYFHPLSTTSMVAVTVSKTASVSFASVLGISAPTVTASAVGPGNSIANVEIFDGTIDLGAATANGNGTWS